MDGMNDERSAPAPADSPDPAGQAEPPVPRVVRRDRDALSAEERRFLERMRADRPPHHDSSWG